jgi:alkanesulfonate monooxygenase SsuD/methylene tetrahydromethanopterin reductase-like flavin-dependent oxidoreductase (luciferase family)
MHTNRVELGIQTRWYEEEYIAYGYDFPSNLTRIKQLDECLKIIKAMWTEKRRASFEGKYYTIKDAICNPKPIQKPHPLIMVGGLGEKYLLKVVAKHADRYNLFFGSPGVRHFILHFIGLNDAVLRLFDSKVIRRI